MPKPDAIDGLIGRAHTLLDRLEQLLPARRAGAPAVDWQHLAWRCHVREGQASLQPIVRRSPIRLQDLLNIDIQKEALDRNTRQFLRGLPANHALLWGPRGTGKSSLVKALLNAHGGLGLRLIEVDRLDLLELPDIGAVLDGRPERFILYCDDLSFDASDSGYRALKAVLDGSLLSMPDNVLIYATSNRRHLLPELQSDNDATRYVEGELHYGEAVEEKISLSERFGIWLAFHPFKQDEYLAIVRHWLTALQADLADWDAIRLAALRWAQLHGSRSGRSAWQFARDWAGQQGLGAGAPRA